jgi:ABC-type dipeptide/oligopeptide/nickel transport system permease component
LRPVADEEGNGLGRYLIRRVLQFIPVFFGATFLIFALVFLMPGDPIRALSGDKPLAPEVVQALQERYHLDEPFYKQYAIYITNVFQGDFGTDFRGRPVSDYLRDRLPVTIRLALLAFGFEVIIGLTAGVVAGVRKGKFFDSLVLVSTLVVIAIPIFVLGFIGQIVFGVKLGWFPISGYREGWYSLMLPALVLASLSLAYVARLSRTSLVENLRADYVRTAKAKGLSTKRVIGIHTLRNSLIPVVTYLAVDLGALMGGAIITETIFNLPGIGRAVFDAARAQEGAVVIGIATFLVVVYMVANLLVDVLYGVLDPRIRYD